MPRKTAVRLDPAERRRALTLTYVSGALWAVGNGVTSGQVLSYFAQDYGARGIWFSLILALPALVGLARLVAPALIRRRGTKRFCLEAFWLSYLVLALLAVVVVCTLGTTAGLAGFIVIVCVHQLLEYCAFVALWSWLAELVPRPVRARYFARRNIWQLLVMVPSIYGLTLWIDSWRDESASRILLAYAAVTALGVALLLASVVPLHWVVSTERKKSPPAWSWRPDLGPWIALLAHRPLRMLIAFGCWLSFFNGLTQVAQNVYPKGVLLLPLSTMALLPTFMRIGQSFVSLWVGPFADRYGNRPALILGQVLVALGPLLYFFASPGPTAANWIGAAYLLWSAYAILNVCQPALMLKLAPRANPAQAVALVLAASSLSYALGTVLGGAWFERLRDRALGLSIGGTDLNRFDVQFLVGWITRTAAVIWLAKIAEPGAWRWREIIAHLRRVAVDNTSPTR